MENYNWEFVHDTIDNTDTYIESMTNGTFIDDEYYEEDNNKWQTYYEEISEEIEY